MERETLHTEDFAWKLAESIVEDFRPFLDFEFHQHAETLIKGRKLEEFRAIKVAEREKPFQFKLQYQVSDLFNKFTFSKDVYSPNEVHEMSVKKFTDNQERLMCHSYESLSPITRSVVFAARGWIDTVLGIYDPVEHMERATFGRKSSVGVPMRKANEAERYENLTGSPDHITWFEHYYSVWNRPAHLYASRRASNRNVGMYSEVSVLAATLVPKTWKSLRMIVPNTTIGSLYSSGLGRLIEVALRKNGYDIKVLQPIHGMLARRGSIDGKLVTADQSLASDNITRTLVEMCLSRKWASALNLGRINKISIDNREIDSPTFSTMGTGFTFPLQTLMFLGLLYGVKDTLGLKNPTISVFGDDMIYSKEMHDTVVHAFTELGLVINEDKTFSEGNFRESCGYDYFHGFDVRPFHLKQADGTKLVGKRAESYLYTVANAVKRRWSLDEVPGTMQMLAQEIERFRKGGLLAVPPEFPDTSGLRLDRTELERFKHRAIRTDIHGTKHFTFLSFKAGRGVEFREWPYYAKALSAPTNEDDPVREYRHKFERNVRCEATHFVGRSMVMSEKSSAMIAMIKPQDLSQEEAARLKKTYATVPTAVLQDVGRYSSERATSFTW